jgi:hypothetical protein
MFYFNLEYEWIKNTAIGRWCPCKLGRTGIQQFDSVNENTCTLAGMNPATAWSVSEGNVALNFDGIDDRVFNSSFAMSAMSDQSNSFSIWINPTTTSTTTRIFSLGQFGTSFAIRFNFQNLEFSFGGTAVLSVPMINTQYQNRWTHICGVTDTSGARLFFDGRLVGTRSDTISLVKTNGLGIGYRFGVNSEFYSGLIDDFTIFATNLTAEQVLQLYLGGRGAGLLPYPPKRRSYFIPPISGWKPYWFRPSSKLIGTGI